MAQVISENRTVTAPEARIAIERCFACKRPVFLWGPPGIGKSELVQQITDDMDGVMLDLRLGQMEPTDIRGIPFYNKDIVKMDWAPPIDLPDPDFAKQYPIVVLFLDEMNSAPPSVLAAAYQLILNRGVGKYKLPDNVVLIAAGNRESDKGVTFRMPTPLSNRFVHLEMRVDFESWFNWAVNNQIHKDVIGYLNFAKNDLYDFNPKSSGRSFATPRSWVFVSELISSKELKNKTVVDLVAGTVGEGLAVKFAAHRKVAGKMPNPIDILNGKVKKLDVQEISAMFSLVISMCYELRNAYDNGLVGDEFHKLADNFFGFMMDNFETELTVMGAKIALITYHLPILPTKLKTYDRFYNRYGKYIINAA